jgi:5,10-methenyltetrahydrofolate synthetase
LREQGAGSGERSGRKAELRAKLKSAAPSDRKSKNAKIFELAVSLPEYKAAESVYIFLSFQNEPDTSGIIEDAFSKGKRVFVPVKGEEPEFQEIFENGKGQSSKVKGKDNFIKYIRDCSLCPAPCSLIFVPMIAFDKKLNRLGRGGGWYDRFLKDFNGIKVGLSYSDFEAPTVFPEAHDIRMDIILTDKGILK